MVKSNVWWCEDLICRVLLWSSWAGGLQGGRDPIQLRFWVLLYLQPAAGLWERSGQASPAAQVCDQSDASYVCTKKSMLSFKNLSVVLNPGVGVLPWSCSLLIQCHGSGQWASCVAPHVHSQITRFWKTHELSLTRSVFTPSPFPLCRLLLCSGLSPAESEFNYLNTARTLELYGVELHYARVRESQMFSHIFIHILMM